MNFILKKTFAKDLYFFCSRSRCETNRGRGESKQLATRHSCYSTQAGGIMEAGEMGKIAELGTAGKRNDPTAMPQRRRR
jgi:hypothetical protein